MKPTGVTWGSPRSFTVARRASAWGFCRYAISCGVKWLIVSSILLVIRTYRLERRVRTQRSQRQTQRSRRVKRWGRHGEGSAYPPTTSSCASLICLLCALCVLLCDHGVPSGIRLPWDLFVAVDDVRGA